MTSSSAPRRHDPRRSTAVHAVAVLALAAIVAGCLTGPAPSVTTAPSVGASQPAGSPPPASADATLGVIGTGNRRDAPEVFIASGSRSLAYAFEVAPRTGRLRVTIDLSNRDDCVTLRMFDPSGVEIMAPEIDYATVCPLQGRSGQAFDIEWSAADPVPGPWRAVVDVSDAVNLALRLRVSVGTEPPTLVEGQLPPDLVPWLPWEFGFAAPASDRPGTAHDRLNQPGPATVSCHPVEEPDDTQCLRFSAGMYNVGAGPMFVTFREDAAFQHVYARDDTPLTFVDNELAGQFVERPAGSGEWHEFHHHRHLAEFVLYELFEVKDATGSLAPVGTGNKHGYCTFAQQIADWDSIGQDPQYASYPDGVFCDDAMTLERGWGDIYRWQRPGQYVSYAPVAEPDGSMRAGRYVLRLTVDPADHITETDETNNVGYALVEVVDGGGLGQDTVVVCEQGMGRDPWDEARQVVADRFAWAKLSADPAYVAPACD